MDKWYSSNVSAALKAVAVPYGYKAGFNGNETNTGYIGGWSATAIVSGALTIPDLAGASGHGYPIALSISECNAYKLMFANGALIANDNLGSHRAWLLRSSGNNSTTQISLITTTGSISTTAADAGGAVTGTAVGMRPAFWVFYGDGAIEEAIPEDAIEEETADDMTEEAATEDTVEDTTAENPAEEIEPEDVEEVIAPGDTEEDASIGDLTEDAATDGAEAAPLTEDTVEDTAAEGAAEDATEEAASDSPAPQSSDD